MSERVCPWWLGYVLAAPMRKLAQNPSRILSPYIKQGDTVLDAGSAMGFFSLPMAHLVGETGHVVSVDLQEKMIRGLKKRAVKVGVEKRMETRVCTARSLCIDDLAEKIDFALAFAVVHEVPDPARFLNEVHSSLRKSGLFLLSEPTGHVTTELFNGTLAVARDIGFHVVSFPVIRRSHSALLAKP
ncbi:MAG: methyltransferase domain-containing protein [Ignavibacteriales bacterium]|nr:methyltransferase domain-containing protein [Ignavibacteriales bacterium]